MVLTTIFRVESLQDMTKLLVCGLALKAKIPIRWLEEQLSSFGFDQPGEQFVHLGKGQFMVGHTNLVLPNLF